MPDVIHNQLQDPKHGPTEQEKARQRIECQQLITAYLDRIPRRTCLDEAHLDKSCSQSDNARADIFVHPRGQQPFCTYRPRRPSRAYAIRSGRVCDCGEPHGIRSPKDWISTPAETDDWDYELADGGHAACVPRVRFAEPLVTEVWGFEPWYHDEYVASDRYWMQGPMNFSLDKSTPEDDNFEVLWLEAHEELEKLYADWALEDRMEIA